METSIMIPGLKKYAIEACEKFSWQFTNHLLLQWIKEDTVEYQQLINTPECISVIGSACYNGYIEVISLFVENGFPVNHDITGEFNPNYCNMLHFATSGRQVPLMQYLLSSGADVNCCSTSGSTPLHSLFKEPYLFDGIFRKMLVPKFLNSLIDVMKFLMESGGNVNFKDNIGMSPLYVAVQQCNIDVARLFIDYGEDVNIVTDFGWTPLLCLVQRLSPSFELVELLLNAGANINFRHFDNSTVLHTAMRTASQNIIELMLEKGGNVNSKNGFNHTPLYEYAFLFNPIEDDDEDGFVGEDGINIVGTLIIEGADTNIFDDHEHTLLHWAAWQGSVNLVKLLIDRGLDVKDKFGKKAINYAAHSSHHKVVHCFIDYYYSKMSL